MTGSPEGSRRVGNGKKAVATLAAVAALAACSARSVDSAQAPQPDTTPSQSRTKEMPQGGVICPPRPNPTPELAIYNCVNTGIAVTLERKPIGGRDTRLTTYHTIATNEYSPPSYGDSRSEDFNRFEGFSGPGVDPSCEILVIFKPSPEFLKPVDRVEEVCP